jgi:hypothetical protein
MKGSSVRSLLDARRRGVRRVLVVAILFITGLAAGAFPPSLHGFGVIVVLILAALDLVLIGSVGGLPFVRTRSLDERERALRDRAYRVGFRMLGLALVLMIVLWIAGSILSAVVLGFGSAGELDAGIHGRTLIALAELLVMMPRLVMAWGDVDVNTASIDLMTASVDRSGLLGTRWLIIPLIVVVWVLGVTLLPAQDAVASSNYTSSISVAGASCAQFVSGRIIGLQFGATIGMRVEVCWNGVDAFVFGDSSDPLPASQLAKYGTYGGPVASADVDPSDPTLTACGGDDSDDFAALVVTCSATIDGAGTLHYREHARVAPLPFSLGARDLTLTLVVTKTGAVTARP